MRPRDRNEAERIDDVLTKFHQEFHPLEGIQEQVRRETFIEQVLESVHRVKYIEKGILSRDISPSRLDPNDELFDPLKAAAWYAREGNHDEACWLTFLFTHFGKNLRTGYRLIRDVYGDLGGRNHWTWARVSIAPETFRHWLAENRQALQNNGGIFGNHRKYISLDPNSPGGTGEAFVSYVNWVRPFDTHRRLFEDAAEESNHNPRESFDYLYRTMRVASFGRTALVDYLCMLAKLDLAPIEPGSPYLTGATGPLRGARLLFGQAAVGIRPRDLDRWLIELESQLKLEMGMQILEDSMCNWQKSPESFIQFRG